MLGLLFFIIIIIIIQGEGHPVLLLHPFICAMTTTVEGSAGESVEYERRSNPSERGGSERARERVSYKTVLKNSK